MMKFLVVLLAFLAPIPCHAASAKESDAYQWRLVEMNPNMAADLLPGATHCGEEQCIFGLHYFFGEGYNKNRKHILFIPGGPGQIVDPHARPLLALEKEYNVIYFDVRGTGLSLIPGSNKYDRFLRAKYVVDDIEKIRQKLDIKSWDAIYAHSWGTIVAQRYAQESEIRTQQDTPSNGQKPETLVKKLVLSAPLARAHQNTEEARRIMIISNLKDIYVNYVNYDSRDKCLDAYEKHDEFIKKTQLGITNIRSPFKKSDNNLDYPEGTDDFCFLMTPESIENIVIELTGLLRRLDAEYGSIGFVVNNYLDLMKTNGFRAMFAYPRELFQAIQRLQFLGGQEQPAFSPDDYRRRRKFSAALLVGYYLTLAKAGRDAATTGNAATDGGSNPDDAKVKICNDQKAQQAPLFEHLPDEWKKRFCRRVNGALKDHKAGVELESVRAFTVFGVYDGISRWVSEMVKEYKRRDCFNGNDVGDIANGQIPTNEGIRAHAQKLGYDPSEEICPWDPKKHPHSVPTLLLKGGADPVIAGRQTEVVFESLGGHRVLIEFPGVGHSMQLADIKIRGKKISGENAIAKIVMEFLGEEINEEPKTKRKHAKSRMEVDRILGQLKATVQPPRSK